MKPFVLIATASVVALTLSACPPLPPPSPPPPSPPPPPLSPTQVSQVCDVTKTILNQVPFMKAGFEPEEPYYRGPDVDPSPINQDIQADLTAAFNLAPATFRAQLCDLQGIYINPTGCVGYDPNTCGSALGDMDKDKEIADNSWGFRQPSGAKYMAISLGLWKNDPQNPCPSSRKVCAPPYQTYLNRLTLALLYRTGEKASGLPQQKYVVAPSFEVSPNSRELSVLATLAHEYGHILWWDTFVQPPGPKTTAVSNTDTFCGGSFYPSGAWQGTKVDIPPHRWIGFGDIRLQPNGSEVLKLPFLVRNGMFRQAAGSLNQIYSSRQWASLLAAFSPDEDFVETFEFSILRRSGLGPLTVRLGHDYPPIPHMPVQVKFDCFGSSSQLPGLR